MEKRIKTLSYCIVAVISMACLGACVPKKVSPSDESVLHNATLAAQEQKNQADDDDDDDGAWEADDDKPMTFAKRYASGYKNQNKIDFSGKASGSTGELLTKARTALGTPYVRGGTSRSGGFDCSGFVQWTYNHVGIQLPRTAREQAQVGKPIRNPDDMQAGDIVAFRHPKRGYHTGIYVGDGKFIHSPRKRNVVRINSLDDPYFSKTFFAVRRLNVNNEGDIEAAEQMLAAYAANPAPKVSADRTSRSKKKSSLRASKSQKKTVKTASKTQKQSRIVAQNSRSSKTKEVGKNAGDSSKNSSKKSATSNKSVKKEQSAKTEKSKKTTKSTSTESKKSSESKKSDNKKTDAKSSAKTGSSKNSTASK